MTDKKQQPPVPTLSAEHGAIVPMHHEHAVSIDLERLTAELAIGFTSDEIESQSQLAGDPVAEKELQSAVGIATSTSGSGSNSNVCSPRTSKWRWIGQKELQYLVTNRRTPPSRSPEGPARVTNLDDANEANVSSSAVVPLDASSEALEQGAFLRVVTESGARMQAVLEGGSEGGRQRIAHILLPTTDDSPERDQLGSPDHSPLPMSGKLPLTAATATAGGKKRKVSSVVGEQNNSSLGHDLEKEKVSNEAMGGGAGEDATKPASDYQHEDDDDSFCRVCHMSTAKADVFTLGCACKDDLGRAHRGCAEMWFRVKGNRQCEICGEVAQNVQLLEPTVDGLANNTSIQDAVITISVHRPATVCWQNRPIRNFLLVFLVAAFLIPWLFRFAYYNR